MNKQDFIPVFLSLGSNLGDRVATLRAAIALLPLSHLRCSDFFESEPVINKNQPWFINCAVAGEADTAPRELLRNLHRIEEKFGRVRNQENRNRPRTLDIDILLYGDYSVNEEGLQVPHPGLTERRFVLLPLSQIAPHVRHPLCNKTIEELLKECADTSIVRPLSS